MLRGYITERNTVRLIVFNQLRPEKGIVYSRDHLRRKCAAGEFPRPISLSDRRIAWIESEIDEHLKQLAEQRTQAAVG